MNSKVLLYYYRLGTRLLHLLGIDQFVGDDEMTGELVNGGKARVSLGKSLHALIISKCSHVIISSSPMLEIRFSCMVAKKKDFFA